MRESKANGEEEKGEWEMTKGRRKKQEGDPFRTEARGDGRRERRVLTTCKTSLMIAVSGWLRCVQVPCRVSTP